MAAGRAGDAVVVLEQSQVLPRLREPLEVLACQEACDQVAVAMRSTHVSQSQAEEDFSRSVRDKKRETIKKKDLKKEKRRNTTNMIQFRL